MVLRNDLPVAAHFALWECPALGGAPLLRQQGRLAGGAAVNVYSVDMRQQVCVLGGGRGRGRGVGGGGAWGIRDEN